MFLSCRIDVFVLGTVVCAEYECDFFEEKIWCVGSHNGGFIIFNSVRKKIK